MRKAIVAGMFYEANKEELNKQIEQCFNKGPGMPRKKSNNKIIGVISPHAGYAYSGIAQAYSYKEIAEAKMPDVYIMLGFNHSGIGGNATSLDDWQTPIGTIRCHTEFAEELIKTNMFKENDSAFSKEHSIEVQLPFLQFVCEEKKDRLKIVPISINLEEDYVALAKIIVAVLKKLKIDAIFIASSDFTHFGYDYGYMPFKTNIKENMYRLDNGAIECILKLDDKKFMKYIEKSGATICGAGPIATLIATSKLLGAKKAELLKYYTSGDIVKNYSSAVGYASIKIE